MGGNKQIHFLKRQDIFIVECRYICALYTYIENSDPNTHIYAQTLYLNISNLYCLNAYHIYYADDICNTYTYVSMKNILLL